MSPVTPAGLLVLLPLTHAPVEEYVEPSGAVYKPLLFNVDPAGTPVGNEFPFIALLNKLPRLDDIPLNPPALPMLDSKD